MSIVVERAGGLVEVLRAHGRAQARRLEEVRLPKALAYAIPALAALVISQTWFSSGRFIASGDLAPFIRDNLTHETGGLWSHSITGAGSPSFQAAARVPELAVLSVAHALGLSNEIAQRIFYAILAVAVAVSVVYLVLAFVEQMIAVILAGLLALLNPFVLQHLPNPLLLWALTLMAVSGGLLVRSARGPRPPALALGSLSLFAGYLALNPPLLAVLGAWIVLVASLGRVVGGAGGSRRALALLLRAAPWAFFLGLWWAVPFGLTFAQAGTGYAVTAQTSVLAWSWTHTRETIPNLLSLSGQWGWVFPEYFPYASAMDRTFWASLRFGMPVLALLAPFAARQARRREATVLLAVAVVLLFLSKGLHPPISGVNLFLYRHVPGMWLLRDPASKLGVPILLIYLVLVALAVDGITDLVHKSSGRPRRWLIRTTSAMAVAALAYPYPIWTGAVVPDRRPLLPSAHVRVPAQWQAIATLLNRSPVPGKALVLPLDDYYQMPTTWGYYGVDAIPRSLLRRPTIQPSQGGYYSDLPGFRSLVAATQLALQTGDFVAVARLLRSLGVTYVILRHDIDLRYFASSRGARHVVDPRTFETGLRAIPSLTRIRSTSVADVYQVRGGGTGALEVARSVLHLRATGPLGLPLAVGSLPAGNAIVDDAVRSTSGAVYVTTPTHPTMRFFSDGGTVIMASRRTSNELARAAIESGGKRSTLRLTHTATVELDGAGLQPISIATLRVPHGAVAAVGVNGRISLVQRKAALVALDPQSQVTAYAAAQRPSNSLERFSAVGDCHSSDTKTLAQAGISAGPLAGEPEPAVRLQARYHSACVYSEVKGFTPRAPYLLRFQYRSLRGRPARVCLSEVGLGRCAALPPLEPSSPTWRTFRAAAPIDPGTAGLRLFLYADGARRGSPTVTEYRDLDVMPLRQVASKSVSLGLPPENSISLRPGSHELRVQASQDASLLPVSSVGDCHHSDAKSLAQAGISGGPLAGNPGAVRLQARFHSACVSSLVKEFTPGAPYLLSFQYRTLSGRPARVCLWEVGPGRCAALPPLEPSSTWRTFRAVSTADSGTTGLRLFLYADGTGGERFTVTEYRRMTVSNAPPFGMVIYPRTAAESAVPSIDWEQAGPTEFRAVLGRVNGASLIVLRESFGSAWKLRWLPVGAAAYHTEVDGYANGWLGEPGPRFRVEIAYEPDIWVHRARMASGIGLLAAGMWAVVGLRKRRPRSSLFGRVRRWAGLLSRHLNRRDTANSNRARS